MGEPRGDISCRAGDSCGDAKRGGVPSEGVAGLLRRGDAGASSSASMSSGGRRSFVISALRLCCQEAASSG